MTPLVIDLNCDLGEGMHNDAAIMPFISSANIACGYHAGNMETMQQTIALCMQHGVAIGAHPSFDDAVNFGRTEMHLSSGAVFELITVQLQQLQYQCKQMGASMHHVKPHGALYNMSARDETLAAVIANAVFHFNPSLILFGLAGSCSVTAAEKVGLKTVHEFFADRTYQLNATLTPRRGPDALITDISQATLQALFIATEQSVVAVSGEKIRPCKQQVLASICLHGDGPHAVEFAKAIHQMFLSKNILIQAAL